MANTMLDSVLCEVLTDENGNTITPSCGVEKLLTLLCECASTEISTLTNSEIDEIIS